MGITYHVAGPADDEDFAQAEYLAELLMASLKGIDCVIHAVLPEDWPAFVSDKSAFLGCKQRAPLVWMASGVVVGGLPEFTAECDRKYGMTARHVDYTVWPKVAAENVAAARAKALGEKLPLIGSTGSGAERGEAVAEALLSGNERYLRGTGASTASAGLPKLPEGVVSTVLALTPLPAPAHELLGCDAGAIFVVPCTPAGIDVLALGNVEHGCLALSTRALLVIGATTADLPVYVQALKDEELGKETPLLPAQTAVLASMRAALSRTLSVAPPRSSPAEVERLCLEEWIREASDVLLSESAILAELRARGEVHVARLACGEEGALSPV